MSNNDLMSEYVTLFCLNYILIILNFSDIFNNGYAP